MLVLLILIPPFRFVRFTIYVYHRHYGYLKFFREGAPLHTQILRAQFMVEPAVSLNHLFSVDLHVLFFVSRSRSLFGVAIITKTKIIILWKRELGVLINLIILITPRFPWLGGYDGGVGKRVYAQVSPHLFVNKNSHPYFIFLSLT
jgi:hypothetical protein